jgi:hypothetical protein
LGFISEFQQAEADIAELMRLDAPPPVRPPSGPRRRVIPIFRSQARAAGGTTSDLVNARIVQGAAEALVGPDVTETEAAKEAIALLKELAPRDLRESMIARRMIALDAMAMETLRLARASTAYPMLRDAYAAQAVSLSRAATSLDEALERRRGGDQRVVEVKHVVVHSGGQAIVGPVTHIAPKTPSPPR